MNRSQCHCRDFRGRNIISEYSSRKENYISNIWEPYNSHPQANWYKAEQYCRFHGMHLASINSAEEQKNLEDHITSFGMGNEHFWSSGTDQGEEGK